MSELERYSWVTIAPHTGGLSTTRLLPRTAFAGSDESDCVRKCQAPSESNAVLGTSVDTNWDGVRPSELASRRWRPHDLRRTCAALVAGGELDQIQFLLGHLSIQTAERYPYKQKLRSAVNDTLGIEPDADS